MKNNGQILVLFIIVLPVILLALVITLEFGKLYINKIKTINIIKETITYGLKNINKSEINNQLNNMMELNIENIDEKIIFISENEIRIKIKQKPFDMFGKKIILTYQYTGIKQEEKIMIEEG